MVQKGRHAPGERAWLWDQSAWSGFNKHQGLLGFFLCMQIWLQQTLLAVESGPTAGTWKVSCYTKTQVVAAFAITDLAGIH